MKKKSLSILIAGSLALFALDNANGQPGNSTAKNYSTTSYNIESGILSGSEKGEGIRHVNIDAVRDFMKRFPLATDVEWRKVETDYVATFIVESNQTMVRYQGNGKWAYTINRYDNEKKQLPGSLVIFMMIAGLTRAWSVTLIHR